MPHSSKLDNIHIFAGGASPRLTSAICSLLNSRQGRGKVLRFAEGDLLVHIDEVVHDQPVYIVQSVSSPVNENFMELLFWLDAANRAGARSITAIIPYFGYAMRDETKMPGVSQRARVCADAIQASGANRVVTLGLPVALAKALFKIPIDNLNAASALCRYVQSVLVEERPQTATNEPSRESSNELVVVSSDFNMAAKAQYYAEELGGDLAIARRYRSRSGSTTPLIGDVTGKTALIVDESVSSCRSLEQIAELLRSHGAKQVFAAVTHGAFVEDSMKIIDRSPIDQLFITDSIETQSAELSPKVHIVSAAPMFAEAIIRLHKHEDL